MRLEAQNYFDMMVRPTYDDFVQHPYKFRLAMLAIVTMAHMVDYWAMESYSGEASRSKMSDAVADCRRLLCEEHPNLADIADAADALKHGRLAQIKDRTRAVNGVEEFRMSLGLFQGNFGSAVFAEAMDVYVRLGENIKFSARAHLKGAIDFWEKKLAERADESGPQCEIT